VSNYQQQLFPEIEKNDVFRNAYAAIPKVMQSSFGKHNKAQNIRGKGFCNIIPQQQLKGGKIVDGTWIAPEHLDSVAALAKDIMEHRRQKELSRIQKLTDDVIDYMSQYFESGVVDAELVKSCTIGNNNIDAVIQRILRECIKKLDWKRHFTHNGESATILYSITVFDKTAAMACVVKQEEVQEIFAAVYMGDLSVIQELQEKYAKKSVKTIEKRLQALIDAMPEWVPEATIKEHLIRQIEAGQKLRKRICGLCWCGT